MRTADLQPEIRCDFPERVNPRLDEVESWSAAWRRRHGLTTAEDDVRFRTARFGELAARAYPDADFEGLAIASDWAVWLFAFDDLYDEERLAQPLHGAIRRLTDLSWALSYEGPVPDDPFAVALRDLVTRVALRSGTSAAGTFSRHVLMYLLALAAEVANQDADYVPTVDEYVVMRRGSGAVPSCLALIPVSTNRLVPGHLAYHPDVARLTELTVDIVCWANDIRSCPKEVARSRHPLNLPVVIARERGCQLPEALELAAARVNGLIREFAELRARVTAWAPLELACYVRGLEAWIRGNLDWSARTPRYTMAA